MGKRMIKSISLTVDIPLVVSLPLTPIDAGNWIPSVFWEYPKTNEDILNDNNPERKPFKVNTTERFIRRSIASAVKGMLRKYDMNVQRDIDPIIPSQEAIKTKIVLIPNKESDLYTTDFVISVMMMQFKRFNHNAIPSYEDACLEYMRTNTYNSLPLIYGDQPLTFEKYLTEKQPLPGPIKIRVPYIPAGTVINFTNPISINESYNGIIEEANRLKREIRQNIAFVE